MILRLQNTLQVQLSNGPGIMPLCASWCRHWMVTGRWFCRWGLGTLRPWGHVVFPCGAMWKGPEVNLWKGISCMIFHFFPGWWKIYLTYFCFLGSDDWIKSNSVVAARSKKTQKHDAQRRNSWKCVFFHLQANETYDTYFQCKLEVFRIYCSFQHWFLRETCCLKRPFDLPPKGIVFF